MKWREMETVFSVLFLIKSMELIFSIDRLGDCAWITSKSKRSFLVIILLAVKKALKFIQQGSGKMESGAMIWKSKRFKLFLIVNFLFRLSEMYNKSVEIYAYSISPMRTFHERAKSSNNAPIRLEYYGRSHYNSVKFLLF